ncbi:MAG: universal stress protein [Gemmatimonadales bacterium]|nr:MAG: universal stress protein [Gemmatimonadales bacterium]
MIDRILLPLDGSERAASAIPVVLDIAGAFGSRVILLRVVRKGEVSGGAFPPDPSEWMLGRTEAEAYLETLRARFREAHVPAEVVVTVGCPADEIVEAAEKHRVQLVAVTTHGEGGGSQFPISGTANKVLKGARTSVLLLPCGMPGPWTRSLRRVLVPVDGSHRAEWAFRMALILAREERGKVMLLHVVRPPALEVPGADDQLRSLAEQYTSHSEWLARRYLTALTARLGIQDVAVDHRVLVDENVCTAIMELAAREQAEFVVLSAHGSGAAPGTGFGTVTRALLDRSELPVLVLQDAPAAAPRREEVVPHEGTREPSPRA